MHTCLLIAQDGVVGNNRSSVGDEPLGKRGIGVIEDVISARKFSAVTLAVAVAVDDMLAVVGPSWYLWQVGG